MGMAARIGDMTLHGGSITIGLPTVLIGGKPAARIGDMHVCPMITPGTPPVPHVGGPISVGSTGVFIGKSPAARSGDMAVCVGPPDTILTGNPRVIIGELSAGAGAGGKVGLGAGGPGSAVKGALFSAALFAIEHLPTEIDEHFLDVIFLDKAKLPICGVNYSMKGPDERLDRGVLGGKIQRNHIPEGDYDITLFAITSLSWSKKECTINKGIEATVKTVGIKSGTKVIFQFFSRQTHCADTLLGEQTKILSGDTCRTTWKFPEAGIGSKPVGYCFIETYFAVLIDHLNEKSPLIPVYTELEIILKDPDNKPVSNEKVKIQLSTGEIKELKTNSSGTVTVPKVPPTVHGVRFLESPRVDREEKDSVSFDGSTASIEQKKQVVPKSSVQNIFYTALYYLYCPHSVNGHKRILKGGGLFEVVPDAKGSLKAKEPVTILSNKMVPVICDTGLVTKKERMEWGNQVFQLECVMDSHGIIPKIWKKEFWTGSIKPKEYTLQGLPKPVQVKCYAPDQYSLQIQFPAFEKTSFGIKSERIIKKDTKNPPDQKGKPDTVIRSKEKSWINKWPQPFSDDAPVTLKRNGSSVEIKFLETVGSIVQLANDVQDIISLITKSTPKWGWYFTSETSFFQGTFLLEWGWKEYQDHRVYWYWGVNIQMKLICLKLEIGVGVSGFGFELQGFGQFEGDLTLSIKCSRPSPDAAAELTIPIAISFIGRIGARFTTKYIVSLEAVLESSIKIVNGKLTIGTTVYLSTPLEWTGLVLKITGSADVGKKKGDIEQLEVELTGMASQNIEKQKETPKGILKQEKVFELVKPKTLSTFEWPKQVDYHPPKMPTAEFHKILVKELSESPPICVYDNLLDIDIKPKEIAQRLEDIIHKNKYVSKNISSLKGLAHKIRKELTKNSEGTGLIFFKKHQISESDFSNFIRNKLDSILFEHKDPVHLLVKKHT